MDIRPILSTLGRHKTAVVLIALEIALTCAIVSNAVFLITGRLERMAEPSGLAESEIVQVQLVGGDKNRSPRAVTREDLAALRALPGVESAAATNQIPFGGSSWNTDVSMHQNQKNPTLIASAYIGSEDLLETMGLELVAGRDFHRDEYISIEDLMAANGEMSIPGVILSQALAQRLFPDGHALGRSIYAWSNNPVRVVGIVGHLIRPNDIGGPDEREYSMILPVSAPLTYGSRYLLRVDPDQRAAALKSAVAALRRVDPSRIVIADGTKTLEAFRHDHFQQDRAMAWLLAGVCVALLVITALGIVGLASFWVQQRTRQIGIRRALGATRGQILGYFQTENFLIATLGIALGMALAFAINGLLMQRYELPRLPWPYLPVGAVVLWVLGQLAVLGPALKAAAVPPAVATRGL